MWEATIGVVGTLAGTVLGWLLARTKKGKLKIQFSKLYKEQAKEINDALSMLHKRYSFNIDLKMYNSGDKPTTARDFEVSFRDNNGKEILRKRIYDDTKTKGTSNAIYFEHIEVVNLSGLSGRDIKARISISQNDVDLAKSAKSLYLIYKNDKLKKTNKNL